VSSRGDARRKNARSRKEEKGKKKGDLYPLQKKKKPMRLSTGTPSILEDKKENNRGRGKGEKRKGRVSSFSTRKKRGKKSVT